MTNPQLYGIMNTERNESEENKMIKCPNCGPTARYKVEWKYLEGEGGFYAHKEQLLYSKQEVDTLLEELYNNPCVYLVHLTTQECLVHRESKRG